MKEFSLKEYNKNPNKKVVTRNGQKVRIICTDRKSDCGYPIVGLVDCKDYECTMYFSTNGKVYDGKTCLPNCVYDLFFAPEKHTAWGFISRSELGMYHPWNNIYETKESAEAMVNRIPMKRPKICKIEWED